MITRDPSCNISSRAGLSLDNKKDYPAMGWKASLTRAISLLRWKREKRPRSKRTKRWCCWTRLTLNLCLSQDQSTLKCSTRSRSGCTTSSIRTCSTRQVRLQSIIQMGAIKLVLAGSSPYLWEYQSLTWSQKILSKSGIVSEQSLPTTQCLSIRE